MRKKMEACPYEAASRAAQCEACCTNSGGLTPCVAAWLASRAGFVDPVEPSHPLSVFELKQKLRRAA